MPCYRCDARQADPVRGASPWRRGVIADEQVLVCPDCQRTHAWTDDLDRCASCGSTMLVRALGETRCKACGAAGSGIAAGGLGAAPAAPPTPAGLADEVSAALDRLLRRE